MYSRRGLSAGSRQAIGAAPRRRGSLTWGLRANDVPASGNREWILRVTMVRRVDEPRWPGPHPAAKEARVKASVPRVVVASGLDGWETQWDRLVDLSPLPSPFMRSWWLTGAGGPQRRFLLAVDGERLIGGLALETTGWPGLEVLHLMGGGYLCPDHLDLLAGPTEEGVTIGLLRDWFQRPGGRLLDLEGVPGHSRLIEALPAQPASSRSPSRRGPRCPTTRRRISPGSPPTSAGTSGGPRPASPRTASHTVETRTFSGGSARDIANDAPGPVGRPLSLSLANSTVRGGLPPGGRGR